jgi:hypothetical protein
MSNMRSDDAADERWEEPDDSEAGVAEEPPGKAGPPAGSNILCETFPDGVTVQIPPAGVWKGSKGLFVFGILWLAIVGPISLCLIGGLFGAIGVQAKKPDANALWIMPLVMSLFWAVGIGMLLAAINMGKRKAALAVTGGSLMVIQSGLFGTKKRQWEPGEVEAVCTGPSGLEVNGEPVLELHIHDGGGKFSLLCGRSDAELEFIASTLRRALGVSSRVR